MYVTRALMLYTILFIHINYSNIILSFLDVCIHTLEQIIIFSTLVKLDFAHARIKKHALNQVLYMYQNNYFSHSVRKARFCTRSNKKALPKLSFSHVVSKNSVRYSSEKVILSSCGLFTLASLGRKRPPRG